MAIGAVQALIDQYPEAAQVPQDGTGNLCLHLAALKGSTDEVVMLLVNTFPDACKVRLASSRVLAGSTPLGSRAHRASLPRASRVGGAVPHRTRSSLLSTRACAPRRSRTLSGRVPRARET